MDLPTLLAGPMIRRADRDNVYIWLATSENFHIEAELTKIHVEGESYRYHKIDTNSKSETVRASEFLYIHLIKVSPERDRLPYDTLIGYNITFRKDKQQLNLSSFHLLDSDNPQSIVYGNLKYPTFYLPQNYPSSILYGSCRKPHGKGKDTLSIADKTIHKNHINLQERPSTLFLMGDQIYADDVADPFFNALSSITKRLNGNRTEKLGKIDDRLANHFHQSQLEKIHGRQYIMDHFCNFTSGNAYNHLIQFSEYAAMYVLVFGPALWENNDLPSFVEILEANKLFFHSTGNNQQKQEKELEKHRLKYNEQLEDLLTFIESLSQVRRVLANTPTYMIFDDHDITDDWNLSLAWKENVSKSALGKHVIANGLTAYWLFQGWGNNPPAFNSDFTNHVSRYLNATSPSKTIYDNWVYQLLNFRSWHFIAPTNPTSLFLDTRTMRDYETNPRTTIGKIIGTEHNLAQLIGTDGWRIISNSLYQSDWKKGEALIIISPTPLYGIRFIEDFLYGYIYPLRFLNRDVLYNLDFEAWRYNGKGLSNFLQQIAEWNPRECMILSGDVHYANAIKSRIEFKNQNNMTIRQYTSSPINNMSFPSITGSLMKSSIWISFMLNGKYEEMRYCDENNNLLEQKDLKNLKWKEEIHYLKPQQGTLIETDNNLGHLMVTNEYAENRLLRYDGENKYERDYFNKAK
ncbi:alkaline phosphatase D family protein [Oceanobacillus rekensis]|uniref:alkaline phosphatase D family protein n=1 Tax=Oceanobacillus rekensis TaxID=937927 RepID=UPI000B4484C4|nr:alkaline phosphatase D family protein [Oceanobacillus rekensis]